jgi:hypothetical protein
MVDCWGSVPNNQEPAIDELFITPRLFSRFTSFSFDVEYCTTVVGCQKEVYVTLPFATYATRRLRVPYSSDATRHIYTTALPSTVDLVVQALDEPHLYAQCLVYTY